MSLKVNEIFYSIQGESTYAGYPCVLIRLSGCNLRCSFCDTRYAYTEGVSMEISEILETVAGYGCPLVEITGGEPLLQEETPALILSLLEKSYRVLMETNGSMDISRVDPRCVRIIDVKCPSSGESHRNDLQNLNRLTGGDEIKFVIADRTDYEYAKMILLRNQRIEEIAVPVHFSPAFGGISLETLASWILEDRLPVRVHVQLHKIIWPGESGR
ncbi:MAG: radical SAM protein [Syntrophales bacterium]